MSSGTSYTTNSEPGVASQVGSNIGTAQSAAPGSTSQQEQAMAVTPFKLTAAQRQKIPLRARPSEDTSVGRLRGSQGAKGTVKKKRVFSHVGRYATLLGLS